MPKSAQSASAASSKKPRPRLPFAQVMAELEAAGTEQARKTYRRHGVVGPTFGVSFATLKGLYGRIRIDHELALQLWETGNFDAQNLAVKIANPQLLTPADLDQWARETTPAMGCGSFVAMLAAEGPHAVAKVAQWGASNLAHERRTFWYLLGQLANRDESLGDEFFSRYIEEIERLMPTASNEERDCMNRALIQVGGRNETLRDLALAAAKRIGPLNLDYGDTSCETPAAGQYIQKYWTNAVARGFASPAAQERKRESPRTRC